MTAPSKSKSRLGRGLGGLIAPARTAPAAAAAAAPAAGPSPAIEAFGYREVPVDRVRPSPYQARREIPAEQLDELVESIRSEGLLQPIVVRRQGDNYSLIAGERRWRAFQKLGIQAIPARIVEASDSSAAVLGLIENLQREALNVIEEAHGFASLIRDFDLTQEDAAGRVGKSRTAVANTLRLLSLDEEIQGYLAKSLLTTGHAKALLGAGDSARRLLLARR
jgi:ParB family chromosome partitioning protein